MNFNTSYNKIIKDENLMETIQHGSSNYPFHFYYDNLALFDFNCIEWHWHAEFEFVYIESGTVTFGIGENQFDLSEGNGVFINSKILHRFYSTQDAIIPNFVCMPFFLAPQDSLIYHKYILPVVTSSLTFQILLAEVPWQAKALEIIRQIIAAQDSISSCELMTSSLLQKLWLKIYENVEIFHNEKPIKDSSSSQARLQLMMQYIHQNYTQVISLDTLSSHATVSKSTALNLFRKYLHITPINYLINYRLKAAALLLINTEKKINTISNETGLNNVDYFCRLFKKHYHLTPTEYRKRKT